MTDTPVESELKIPVTNLDAVRAALQRARATVEQLAAREVNLLLDTEDGRLRNSGSVLRLRQHGARNILTFKGPVSYEGSIKVREEYETEFANFPRMIEVFEHLGFAVYMRYEKDREEWLLEGYSVVLDHTPMGNFVEVEGPPERLEGTAVLLGLDTNAAIRGSYVGLWQDYRASHPTLGLPFDMVFHR